MIRGQFEPPRPPWGKGGLALLATHSAPAHRKNSLSARIKHAATSYEISGLKVIKPGMDTREVIARFEAERQVLARMDHPNIAKVFDAERTETGRPYFVMQLVEGVPITNYCDECELTTRERLELFVTVCQVVQHAHQRGVIHRDLKPTNVLAAIRTGQPAPKIIDFGVAKAIQQRLTDSTLTTAFAQLVGTPMYMSPEQAELSPLGVDTRTDVYSLGVLLYELLTGTTPFDKERVYAASSDEMRRIIREEEPPRPSARISMFKADLATTIGERHRTDTRRLLQSVHGELDWIVMKCLEKDRNRRYESASAMADDVQRHLVDEPVGGLPSISYIPSPENDASVQRNYGGRSDSRRYPRRFVRFQHLAGGAATRAFDAEFAARKDADDAKLKAEAEAKTPRPKRRSPRPSTILSTRIYFSKPIPSGPPTIDTTSRPATSSCGPCLTGRPRPRPAPCRSAAGRGCVAAHDWRHLRVSGR